MNIAIEAIDRLHTTAERHHRALIVEVMGRHAGWIALHAGLAGGANVILIPERPFDIEKVCAYVKHRFQTRYAPIVVVAEGAHPASEDVAVADGQLDAFGHVRLGGVGQMLADEIEKRTGKEARATVLGHIQRGGTPTAFDRVLATRFGVHAVDAVHDEALRHHGGAARHQHRPRSARRGDQRAQARARRTAMPKPRSSSADRCPSYRRESNRRESDRRRPAYQAGRFEARHRGALARHSPVRNMLKYRDLSVAV